MNISREIEVSIRDISNHDDIQVSTACSEVFISVNNSQVCFDIEDAEAVANALLIVHQEVNKYA